MIFPEKFHIMLVRLGTTILLLKNFQTQIKIVIKSTYASLLYFLVITKILNIEFNLGMTAPSCHISPISDAAMDPQPEGRHEVF